MFAKQSIARVPSNLFPYNCKLCRACNEERERGISPVNKLSPRSKVCKFFKEPRLVGRLPEREFE
jgi:hypothetical protein